MRAKGYIGIGLVCLFYWLLDSVWSYISFEFNLKQLIFKAPVSIFDTLLLMVPPYQIVSRLMVLTLFIVCGAMLIEIIHRRQKAEKGRKEAHDTFLTVLNSIDATIFVSDLKTYEILFMNRYMIQKYGQDLTGKTCFHAFRNFDNPCEDCKLNELLDDSGNPAGVIIWEKLNKELDAWYLNHDRAIKWIDERLVHLQIAFEITDHKKVEEHIRESLTEKETLLKEVHHRVKNNMQLVISLLNMQRERITRGEESSYDDLINRIRIFGDIHRRLYQQDTLSKINFERHLRENLKDLIKAYDVNSYDIEFSLEMDNPIFDLEKAPACGLLMNELISNSLKHAFDERGSIHIIINQDEQGNLSRIVYSDNGRGMEVPANGFGTKIINSLAEQLDMELKIAVNGGTFYEFTRLEDEEQPEKPCGRILFVEDEILIAMDKIAYLKKQGFSVDDNVLTSGEKAIRYIEKLDQKPSLIIMDIGLQGEMNGLDAAEIIREDNPSIPILFISGYEDTETQRRIASISNTGFINKLSSHEALRQMVQQHQQP